MKPFDVEAWTREAGLQARYRFDGGPLVGHVGALVELGLDRDTAEYLRRTAEAPHAAELTALQREMCETRSTYDVNGELGTYPVHVLSSGQWARLLDAARVERPEGRLGSLLDVGSGRGDATSALAVHFERVTTNETSAPMIQRLRAQGFTCLEGDLTALPTRPGRFDAVSLLNVLDRCDRPHALLATAISTLRPGGLLLLSLVLPYRPFVFDGSKKRPPTQRLPLGPPSDPFEQQCADLVTAVLVPLGVEVAVLSRAPYLSWGDAHAPVYELDAAILICRLRAGVEPLDFEG